MHLRNAAVVHTQVHGDRFHTHVPAVIQTDDLLVAGRKVFDQTIQHVAQLPLRTDVIGIGIAATGGVCFEAILGRG